MNYLCALSQYHSDVPDTVIGAQQFYINRVERTLFTANAGADQELIVGDSLTLSAASIGEDAFYYWYDESGTRIDTTINIRVAPTESTSYTLEVIARSDGYKDYDQVQLTVTKGKITGIVPNPSSGGTIEVAYKVSGVTAATIKVVEVSTSNLVYNTAIMPGSGTEYISVSTFNNGSYSIILEGDNQLIDSKLFIKQ